MSTTILAIDPGPTKSAWLMLHDGKPIDFAIDANDIVLEGLDAGQCPPATQLVIEQVKSFGMPVGEEVFETVFVSGRFAQAWGGEFHRIGRQDVKLHLCRSVRAKDANVRQALIDKFGGSAAIGKKKTPGPLYGIAKDVWAALAVAVTWAETGGGVQ